MDHFRRIFLNRCAHRKITCVVTFDGFGDTFLMATVNKRLKDYRNHLNKDEYSYS